MIVVSSYPNVGETVQAGEYAEMVGVLERIDGAILTVKVGDEHVKCAAGEVFLLSERTITVGPDTFPIERAAQWLPGGFSSATSTTDDETFHKGSVFVASHSEWFCYNSCAACRETV